MCLDPEDEAVVNHAVPETDLKRNIIRNGKKLWPGKTVYYFVDDNLSKFFFLFFLSSSRITVILVFSNNNAVQMYNQNSM